LTEKNRPPPHPQPPGDFSSRPLALIRVSRSQSWFRFHNRKHHPLFFAATGLSRFDDPDREFGVMYIARQLEGAFVEKFLRDTGNHERTWSLRMFDSVALATVRSNRSLQLVDLGGRGLAMMSVDSRLGSGEYNTAQRWAAAIYHHPQQPDGIQYASWHNPKQLCAALFDRVNDTIVPEDAGTMREYLGDTRFYALLNRYGVGLI
jgi:hypothetical protein